MFAILFFLLGIICKALAAAFNTLVELTVYLGCILIIVGIVLIALYLIFGIVDDAVTKKNLTEFLVDMIWIAISIAIFGAIFVGVGSVALIIAGYAAAILAAVISVILEGAAVLCEALYEKSLTTITKRIADW